MPARKVKTTPRKKQVSLIPEPNWDRLKKAKSEEVREKAFRECEDYVHQEVPDREQLHWLKKWLRDESGWDNAHQNSVTIPDVFLLAYAKSGWKAIKLGYMPNKIRESLTENLNPLLQNAEELKSKNTAEPPIHPTVSSRDKEDYLHPDKVKKWIAVWKDYLRANKVNADSKDSKLRMDYQSAENYIHNMNNYLRSGIWSDLFYGENREHRTMWVSKSMAYDSEGMVKRTIGVFYPDIGFVWGKEGEFYES